MRKVIIVSLVIISGYCRLGLAANCPPGTDTAWHQAGPTASFSINTPLAGKIISAIPSVTVEEKKAATFSIYNRNCCKNGEVTINGDKAYEGSFGYKITAKDVELWGKTSPEITVVNALGITYKMKFKAGVFFKTALSLTGTAGKRVAGCTDPEEEWLYFKLSSGATISLDAEGSITTTYQSFGDPDVNTFGVTFASATMDIMTSCTWNSREEKSGWGATSFTVTSVDVSGDVKLGVYKPGYKLHLYPGSVTIKMTNSVGN